MVRDGTQHVDVITGLKQKTHFGRPDWNDIFKEISHDNPRWEISTETSSYSLTVLQIFLLLR